jgi:hypothetical protein
MGEHSIFTCKQSDCDKIECKQDLNIQRRRERFEAAKAAMQGELAAQQASGFYFGVGSFNDLAKNCVKMADALLRELDKEPGAE